MVYEENKSADRNLAEYEAMIAAISYKPSFTDTSVHIAGARTSDTVFTPTVSESWTVDGLIGKVMVAFVNTALSAFSVHKVVDNTADAVTIVSDGSYGAVALIASADRIIIFDTWDDAQAYVTYVATS